MRGVTSLVMVLGFGVSFASAFDAPILGQQLLIKDPKPSLDASKRSLVAAAKEKASPDALAGSPELTGATVTVFAFGATSASQAFVLPGGTDSATGKPFWKTSTTAFKYKDAKGSAGPIRSVDIKKSAGGTFTIKVVASGKHGALLVTPPDPGSSGCVRIDLDAGAVRYHVLLPPEPDAAVKTNDARTFLIKDAQRQGTCPPATPVCGNGIVEPGESCDGSPFCTSSCFLDIPSCCVAANQCVDAPGFSLISLILQYCGGALPGFTNIVTGGVCAADGSCSEQPIAPLHVCCQRNGACEDATVSDTGALYDFHAACQGPQTGTTTLGAVCAPSGSCAQG